MPTDPLRQLDPWERYFDARKADGERTCIHDALSIVPARPVAIGAARRPVTVDDLHGLGERLLARIEILIASTYVHEASSTVNNVPVGNA